MKKVDLLNPVQACMALSDRTDPAVCVRVSGATSAAAATFVKLRVTQCRVDQANKTSALRSTRGGIHKYLSWETARTWFDHPIILIANSTPPAALLSTLKHHVLRAKPCLWIVRVYLLAL